MQPKTPSVAFAHCTCHDRASVPICVLMFACRRPCWQSGSSSSSSSELSKLLACMQSHLGSSVSTVPIEVADVDHTLADDCGWESEYLVLQTVRATHVFQERPWLDCVEGNDRPVVSVHGRAPQH